MNETILLAIESSAKIATDNCLPYNKSIASAGATSKMFSSISGNFSYKCPAALGSKFLATDDNKPTEISPF